MIDWAAGMIQNFVDREAQKGLDHRNWLQQDTNSFARLNLHFGLIDRITVQYPTPAAAP
jgi:hypothetical protein